MNWTDFEHKISDEASKAAAGSLSWYRAFTMSHPNTIGIAALVIGIVIGFWLRGL